MFLSTSFSDLKSRFGRSCGPGGNGNQTLIERGENLLDPRKGRILAAGFEGTDRWLRDPENVGEGALAQARTEASGLDVITG